MKVEPLGTDAWLLRGKTYDSNSAVFVNNGQALLVDAMGSHADAQDLKEYVEGTLGKRVRFIVSTHYFSDHMAALALFPESSIIAHRGHRQTFDEERYRTEEERAFFVRPTIEIGEGLTLRWGRHTLDVFHNPGHTESTLAIDVPEADLLIAGDTVVGNIGYFLYSSPPLLAAAIRRLRERGRGRLLSSHGGVSEPARLDNALSYLGTLERHVRDARGAAGFEEAVLGIPLARCLPEEVAPTSFEEIFHRRNLETVLARHLFDG